MLELNIDFLNKVNMPNDIINAFSIWNMIRFIVISLIKCNLFNGNLEYFSEIFFHMIS
jgi:hypothetical protein